MPDELGGHLDAVHAAAERLVREAGGRVPPAGWDVGPADRPARDPFAPPELTAVSQVLDLVRAAVPPELAQQVREAVRELLLAIRALIDWYLDRIEREAAGDPEVQDIPID